MIRFLYLLFDDCCKKSTAGPIVRSWLSFAIAWISLTVHFGPITSGQWIETFDRPGEYFRLWRDDCRAVLQRPSKLEPGIETLELSFGHGTYVHLLFPIEPCAVVDDLTASIRLRCVHDGLRLAIRVVYPNSAHRATSDPLYTLVFGTAAEGNGRWSTSTVRNIRREVETHQRLLRAKHGPDVDFSNPYVDAVVVDAYRFPGTTKLQIDDLQIDGMIPPSSPAVALMNESRDGTPQLSAAERLSLMQSTVPRWIQYHGENLEHLQQLGFNGVIAPRADDIRLIEQAVSTKLAVIAPPPSFVPADALENEFSHVQAWMLGWELNESSLDATRNQVSKLTRFPQTLARPTIGEAMEMYGSFSRLTDWLAVPTPHTTRVRSFDETDQILHSESRSLAGRSMPLTSMVTQMSSEWMEQKAMLQNIVGGDAIGLPDYDLLSTRLAVYRAMMQGTRGWIFRSSGPLDRGDPTTTARAQGYKSINSEIDLFSPWIHSNQYAWKSVTTDSPNHRAAVLTAPNSQLVILVASGPMDQICPVAPDTERLQIAIPAAGQVRHVFRITHGHLETLRSEQRSDAVYAVIDRPGLIEQIVTVVDPKPIEYLRTQLEAKASTMMEGRIDAAEQAITLSQMAFVAQKLPPSHPSWERIQKARTLHHEALHAMSRSNTITALKKADESILLSQRVLRQSWEEAVAQFPAFQSSPFVASPLALPLHWELNKILQGRPWQPLGIPGIPMSSWESMQQQGWRVDQRLTDSIATQVAIAASEPGGAPVLTLVSASTSGQPVSTGYAGAAMRVSSAPIVAPVGSMVHITGEVYVESPANEPQSGLLISDSLGGESLGQLLSSADRSEKPWRTFGLSRMVTNPAGFQIYFETRGAMQAQIRNLQTEMIVPTPPRGIPVRTLEENELPEIPRPSDRP